ncbi:hypothetical protein FB45DRAFT_877525 [Roridomyces roridus]|uniref:Polyketide synthase n=1 Tax=Roridomyces roridus TaxID=1738132 RepID=A0AAD7FAD2_9AGAR|nr:hypothetical protein FB45DRAFT_877525 [Roridomyces roridus]
MNFLKRLREASYQLPKWLGIRRETEKIPTALPELESLKWTAERVDALTKLRHGRRWSFERDDILNSTTVCKNQDQPVGGESSAGTASGRIPRLGRLWSPMPLRVVLVLHSAVVDTTFGMRLMCTTALERRSSSFPCSHERRDALALPPAPIFLSLDRGHFLSPTGQCEPFRVDASVDGYSRIFIFEDVFTETDDIFGGIRGIERAPIPHRPPALRSAGNPLPVLAHAGIEPATRVNVVDARETVTRASDFREEQSLPAVLAVAAFHKHQSKRRPLPLAALGLNLNPLFTAFDRANVVIAMANAEWVSSHPGKPRVALLDNFGASGSNTALILEEHAKPTTTHQTFDMSFKPASARQICASPQAHKPGPETHKVPRSTPIELHIFISFDPESDCPTFNHFRDFNPCFDLATLCDKLPSPTRSQDLCQKTDAPLPSDMSFVLGLSAKTLPALEELRVKYLEWLRSPASAALSLGDIAYTMMARRQLYSYRLAVMASVLSAVVRHSLGEYAVLVTKCAINSSTMIAVNLGAEAIQEFLRQSSHFADLIVACYNSPADCVVAGSLPQLMDFKEHLAAEVSCKSVMLPMHFGCHSIVTDLANAPPAPRHLRTSLAMSSSPETHPSYRRTFFPPLTAFRDRVGRPISSCADMCLPR